MEQPLWRSTGLTIRIGEYAETPETDYWLLLEFIPVRFSQEGAERAKVKLEIGVGGRRFLRRLALGFLAGLASLLGLLFGAGVAFGDTTICGLANETTLIDSDEFLTAQCAAGNERISAAEVGVYMSAEVTGLTDAQLASSYSGVGACPANQAATTLLDNAAPTCTEFSALGQTIGDAELVSNYSGTGDCGAGNFARTLNDNAAPTCGADDDVPDATEVTEAALASEDYGDFTCGAGADDCLLDANSVATGDILNGEIDPLDMNADARAVTCLYLDQELIAIADEWEIELNGAPGTMLEFRCEALGGTSFTVNVCDGEDLGDDTCTTSILGGTLVCDTTGASDSTLSATGYAANDSVSVVVTAVSGTVTRARMKMNCQKD